MVNVALLVVAGATFLNSISVILLAVYARKKEKEIRKLKLEQDKMWKSTTENIWVSDQSRDKQIENLQKDLKDMYMERSVVRNISVPKKYFMTRTFNEKRGKKKELADYVAAVALKTIASELPEEARGHRECYHTQNQGIIK